MSAQFIKPGLPLLVFTDLDGTLLDHDDYSFAAARPALARLHDLGVPVIPTTSKTLAELQVLNRTLENPHPCIVENGSAMCIPEGYFGAVHGATIIGGYAVLRLAPGYEALLETLHDLRDQYGFHFRGFSDMSAEAVAAETGLSIAEAAHARQRLCSEPLVWEDTLETFDQFVALLADRGWTLTRGGRYWHVMAGQSKADAMTRMQALYVDAAGCDLTTIALGDSPNDEAMLRAADIAVVVRRPDGSHLDTAGMQRVRVTAAIGPAGWNESLQTLIDEFTQAHPQGGAATRSG